MEKHKRELDALKAELNKLRYVVENHKQEEELAKLRNESEVREVRRKAEEDFKKMQHAEGERAKAVRQYESLQKEVKEVKDASVNEKAALERRVRDSEESKRMIEEELEDLRSEREESMRIIERRAAELETRNQTLQRTIEELQNDFDSREALLQDTQQQLAGKNTAIGELEAEILRLKAQTGDVDTLAIIKRELSEQVTHIRKLEMANREQASELKHFKRLHKSVEVVEEEKRSLQRRIDAMEALERDLGEARIQRQRLEDERLAWTAYLESQSDPNGMELEFDSPEAVARALVAERLQTAALVEELGSLKPEVESKDGVIQTLESEKAILQQEVEKLRTSGVATGNNKAQLRLERQKALAVKEAEFLRAQLKSYDTEDTTLSPETLDEAKMSRISELEQLVEQFRQEVLTLSDELSAMSKESVPQPELAGHKRVRDEGYPSSDASSREDNEKIGQLTRKTRKLQDELRAQQTSNKLLQKELSVAQERLEAAKTRSQTRVLSLRSNPTSDYEAIKLTKLTALQKENSDLLAQLQSRPVDTVPLSVLEATKLLVKEAEDAVAFERKSKDRLKKVWGATSGKIRENIITALGWDVTFVRDGVIKTTSSFYPSQGDEENSIVFDLKAGTMKVSGGRQSKFADKIAGPRAFWSSNDRDMNIPCFLAQLTLEFHDEMRKDETMRVG